MAIPMPAMRPSADAINPVTNASTTTEVMTCRRLAPIARSSASSRVRCATMIENVLKMMNAPTNSAMNAKTSSAVRKNPSASCNCFACSSATSDDLTASTPFGSTAWMLDRRSRHRRAVGGDDVDLVELPVLVEHLLRGGRVERGERRAREVVRLAEPERCPTIVNSCGGPWSRILMVSPTDRSNFLAVAASTATSRRAGGRLPFAERERRRGTVGPARAERRRPDAADRVARRGIDHLRVSGHGPGRVRDARHRLHGGQDVLRHRLAFVAAAAAGPQLTGRERRFGANDDVAPGDDLREQIRERLVHRVGQHERAGDEPHAEDDRERRERQPELAGDAGS